MIYIYIHLKAPLSDSYPTNKVIFHPTPILMTRFSDNFFGKFPVII